MAASTCPRCGKSTFEMKQNEPSGSAFKLLFVQCSSCGAVVGVTEYFNNGKPIKELDARVKALEKDIKYIRASV